jgi:hypothetical protein
VRQRLIGRGRVFGKSDYRTADSSRWGSNRSTDGRRREIGHLHGTTRAAAIVGGLLLGISLGSAILLARKMAEPPGS